MDKRGNLQNVGYPVFFTPGAIAKLSFICDGEVTKVLTRLHTKAVDKTQVGHREYQKQAKRSTQGRP